MTEKFFVQLLNITKSFDDEEIVVKDLNLGIKKGEFLTLLGPSGCGKTTTLRMIAGFEVPNCGEVIIDGETVTGKAPHERSVNTVFQNYALFPHMNIFDNIAFGLKMKKVNKEEIKVKVSEMLKMVQLEGYENRMPAQLSGGQMQRVAIARAIINSPKVLLLDEPLGALDLKLRKQMQLELKHLQKKLGITFIFVTHDQEEALTMSDRIVVMNKGVIEQVGTPEELYETPATKFVADFLGETNLLDGEVIEIKEEYATLKAGEDIVTIPKGPFEVGDELSVSIRPERIKIKTETSSEEVFLKGILKERIYIGSNIKTVMVLNSGREIIVNEPIDNKFDFNNKEEQVYLTWNKNNSIVIKA